MHLTRNDLGHERAVRLAHSQTRRGSRPLQSLGMDCAVSPQEWIACLANVQESLDRLVRRRRPNEEQARSLEALRRLRLGGHQGDVHVYHGRRHPRLHYVYSVRCARDACPCALKHSAHVACPKRYQFDGEQSDRLAPRILIVDSDWNQPAAVQGFLENVALWHQRVESWRGAVRTLAVAILGDGEDSLRDAKEVAKTLFEDLAENPAGLSERCFSATDFWRLCARQTIERCQDFCGPGAIVRLDPDYVVERMRYLQRELNRRAVDREHLYKYPLAVSIQRGEAEIARAELQNHMIRLLQAEPRGNPAD